MGFKLFRSKSDESKKTNVQEESKVQPQSFQTFGQKEVPKSTSSSSSYPSKTETIIIKASSNNVKSHPKSTMNNTKDENPVPIKCMFNYQDYVDEYYRKDDEFYAPIKPFVDAIDGDGWKNTISQGDYSDSDFELAKERAKAVYKQFDGDFKKSKNFIFEGMKVGDKPYILAMHILTWADTKVSTDEMKKKGISEYMIECNDRDSCCKQHAEGMHFLNDDCALPPFKMGCRCRIIKTDGSPFVKIDLQSSKKKKECDSSKPATLQMSFDKDIKNIEGDRCEYLVGMATQEQISRAKKIAIEMYRDGKGVIPKYAVKNYTSDPFEQKLVMTLCTHSNTINEIRAAVQIYEKYKGQTPRFIIQCSVNECPYCKQFEGREFVYTSSDAKYPPFYLGCSCRLMTTPAQR